MKADLTLNSFDPLKHFSRVLMQQGRVQLDADWNAEASILLNMLRHLAADIIGPAGTSDNGFLISPLTGINVTDDFLIGAGSYYVDGIRCELESTPVPVVVTDASSGEVTVNLWTVDELPFAKGESVSVTFGSTPATMAQVTEPIDYANRTLTLNPFPSGVSNSTTGTLARLTTYTSQPDLPDPPELKGASLIYLDVWERLITCFEDDSIREVALNGPDTAARTRIVWQVKALNGVTSCQTPQWLAQTLQPGDPGYLKARVTPSAASTDPCIVSPTSAYYGPENQLYRVEINRASGDEKGRPATFKWSRENGAVVFPILKLSKGSGLTTVTLANLGRDDRFGLVEGDYVEVEDDASVLNNQSAQLLQVQSIDTSNLIVVLSGSPGDNVGTDPQRHPLLRRWDQKAGDPVEGGLQISDDNAVPIPAFGTSFGSSVWLPLEDGVEVAFVGDATTAFYTGDYWMIPARVATGNVIWPTEAGQDAAGNAVVNPVAKPPDGVKHHYAALGIITPGSTDVSSCRYTFSTIAQPPTTKSKRG